MTTRDSFLMASARAIVACAALSLGAGSLGAAEERSPKDWSAYRHAVPDHSRIPAFARLYGTACSTCHTAAPKLNVLGEAFRLAGYRLPDNDLLVRRDRPVSLGAEPWKDEWPRAVWPSDLPGLAPLAIRVQSDVRSERGSDGEARLSYDFPHEVYLLAGAPLGESVSAFLETEWSEEEGLSVIQAKIGFRNVVPGLPTGVANLMVGRLNPFLLSFTDRQIDRAGFAGFAWQFFSLDEVGISVPGGENVRSKNEVRLGTGMPALEVNGVLRGRIHYGLGLAQGGDDNGEDINGRKDIYYRLRYKFGGLDLTGRYDTGDGPVLGAGGQLLDRSVILEHFGYFGDESTAEDPQGPHRALGWSARWLFGAWDTGVGRVARRYARPFRTASGDVRADAWFAKVDYLLFPWVLGTLKYDRLDVRAEASSLPSGATLQAGDRRRLTSGAALLIRQNVRLAIEGRFYLNGDARVGASRPFDLLTRLDIVF